MDKGYVQVFCGKGKGKTSAAIGKGVLEAGSGKNVIVIQFLKGKNKNEMELIGRLEPEIKLFRFEKSDLAFASLTQEAKVEEVNNIKNGMNFAKKVLLTGECDILILDEVLDLIGEGIISINDIASLIMAKSDQVKLILTGISLPMELTDLVDEVSEIEMVK